MKLNKRMEECVWLLLKIQYQYVPRYGLQGIDLGGETLTTKSLCEFIDKVEHINERMVRITYTMVLGKLLSLPFKKRQTVIDHAVWLMHAVERTKFDEYLDEVLETGKKKKLGDLLK